MFSCCVQIILLVLSRSGALNSTYSKFLMYNIDSMPVPSTLTEHLVSDLCRGFLNFTFNSKLAPSVFWSPGYNKFKLLIKRYHRVIQFSSCTSEIVSEYDQEKQQSQTADNPMAQRGRAAQPSRDTRNTN